MHCAGVCRGNPSTRKDEVPSCGSDSLKTTQLLCNLTQIVCAHTDTDTRTHLLHPELSTRAEGSGVEGQHGWIGLDLVIERPGSHFSRSCKRPLRNQIEEKNIT